MYRPFYTHVTLECNGSPFEVLDSIEVVTDILHLVAGKCGLHVVKEGFHKFRPQGITGYLLLEESHISIHTWPEEGFALIDVLTCSEIEIELLKQIIKEQTRPQNMLVSLHTTRTETAKVKK